MTHLYAPTVPRSSRVVCQRCGDTTTAVQWTSGMTSACRGPVAELPAEAPGRRPPSHAKTIRKAALESTAEGASE